MFFGDFSTQEIGEDSKMNQIKHEIFQPPFSRGFMLSRSL